MPFEDGCADATWMSPCAFCSLKTNIGLAIGVNVGDISDHLSGQFGGVAIHYIGVSQGSWQFGGVK